MDKTIFRNGKIFTSDNDKLYAEAMIVEDGIVEWIGNEDELGNVGETDVDLMGARVIPGLIDAHMHPTLLADFSKKISVLPPNITSLEELVQEIKKVRQYQGKEKWIEGWGYDEGKLKEKRSPNRYDLDKGADDIPISIIRTCGHIRCVNSKALELAGITKDTPNPQGGEIEKDSNGEPTGVLKENARNLVSVLIDGTSETQLIDNMLSLGDLLTSQGIVAVADMGALDSKDYYKVYESVMKKGFKQKVAMYLMWDDYANQRNFTIEKSRMNKNNQLKVNGIKVIGDGSVSGRTAWMSRAYNGNETEFGFPVCSDELLESAISFCKKNKCQLSMHAMGGKAIERIVDRVYKEKQWMEDMPFLRVEHVTDPTMESLDKAVEKDFAFVTQPIFLYAEIESYMKNLGEEWMKKCYPNKTMIKKGINLIFSTDAPATSWAIPSNPFVCLESAVTRVAYDGTNCGSEETVDIESALKMYTVKAAAVLGFENNGMLKAGYSADFVVLSKDILEVPSEKIHTIEAKYTYIKGEKVYSK